MRILVVKTSSLGDVIHTLPAVSDARRAHRQVQIDWVVEENFAEIPAWHPAVDRVIPVALRRWRRSPFSSLRSGEPGAFKRQLQRQHYDMVIDAQGLIKSGVLCRMAHGITVGLSNSTVREPLATLFYNKSFSVDRNAHAVERVRELFSRALNYSIEGFPADYGLDPGRIGVAAPVPEKSLVFLHGTTWESKHWPEPYWRELTRLATGQGYTVKLPWGSEDERKRAQRIASGFAGARVLDRETLGGMAGHLLTAAGVVAVDTGLGHLAAALEVPCVSLYGPTDSGLSGAYGSQQLHLKSGFGCAPCLSRKCLYQGKAVVENLGEGSFQVSSPCFSSQPPATVFRALEGLVQGRLALHTPTGVKA